MACGGEAPASASATLSTHAQSATLTTHDLHHARSAAMLQRWRGPTTPSWRTATATACTATYRGLLLSLCTATVEDILAPDFGWAEIKIRLGNFHCCPRPATRLAAHCHALLLPRPRPATAMGRRPSHLVLLRTAAAKGGAARRRSVRLPIYFAPWSDNSNPTWSGRAVSVRVANTASTLKEEPALCFPHSPATRSPAIERLSNP